MCSSYRGRHLQADVELVKDRDGWGVRVRVPAVGHSDVGGVVALGAKDAAEGAACTGDQRCVVLCHGAVAVYRYGYVAHVIGSGVCCGHLEKHGREM